MAGYIRTDTANNIADGNIINAADLDGEFDSIQSAFVNTTGHTHDGTAAEGAPITKIGPAQDVVASAIDLKPKTTNTIDLGSNSLKFKNIYAAGTAFVATLDLTNALTVADGGTGAATFTANNVLLGNGTSAFQVVAPGTNGNVLTSNGTTWQSTAPSANVASITFGSTGLTPSTATTGAVTVAGTLAAANGGTGVANNAANTITFSGAFGITMTLTSTTAITFPTSGTLATLAGTETLTNKRVTQRINSITDSATITPTGDSSDQYNVTALAQPATVAAPSGTPTSGQKLILRIKDNGTGRALTWTTSSGGYRVVGVTLPTTTTANKTAYIGCIYNSDATFWDVVAVTTEV